VRLCVGRRKREVKAKPPAQKTLAREAPCKITTRTQPGTLAVFNVEQVALNRHGYAVNLTDEIYTTVKKVLHPIYPPRSSGKFLTVFPGHTYSQASLPFEANLGQALPEGQCATLDFITTLLRIASSTGGGGLRARMLCARDADDKEELSDVKVFDQSQPQLPF
jgi:hypothetical protein